MCCLKQLKWKEISSRLFPHILSFLLSEYQLHSPLPQISFLLEVSAMASVAFGAHTFAIQEEKGFLTLGPMSRIPGKGSDLPSLAHVPIFWSKPYDQQNGDRGQQPPSGPPIVSIQGLATSFSQWDQKKLQHAGSQGRKDLQVWEQQGLLCTTPRAHFMGFHVNDALQACKGSVVA